MSAQGFLNDIGSVGGSIRNSFTVVDCRTLCPGSSKPTRWRQKRYTRFSWRNLLPKSFVYTARTAESTRSVVVVRRLYPPSARSDSPKVLNFSCDEYVDGLSTGVHAPTILLLSHCMFVAAFTTRVSWSWRMFWRSFLCCPWSTFVLWRALQILLFRRRPCGTICGSRSRCSFSTAIGMLFSASRMMGRRRMRIMRNRQCALRSFYARSLFCCFLLASIHSPSWKSSRLSSSRQLCKRLTCPRFLIVSFIGTNDWMIPSCAFGVVCCFVDLVRCSTNTQNDYWKW